MILFSNSLFGDVVVWFKCLGDDSIGSWVELCNAFLKWWGENKSLNRYWDDFNALRRGEEEALAVFNMRFYHVYHNMPVEIRPIETAPMVYYVMARHSDLFLHLRERKSTSLSQLFMDVGEVEENLRAYGRIQSQYHLDSECKAVFTYYPYEEKTMDNFVYDAGIHEQPCIDENHVYEQLGEIVTTFLEIDIFNSYFPDKICWHRGRPRVQRFNNAPTKP
jgi:hypothetical protein